MERSRLHRLRRSALAGAALAGLALAATGPAAAQDVSGEITVWSWNVAANALKAVVPDFNKKYPNVKVTVEDLGNQPVYDRGLAACAAGGSGMPDVYTVENHESEVFWARFPDCFRDVKTMSAGEPALLSKYPAFKLTDLTVGDKVYAVPWDSGPAAVFYRRDMYEKAGVDPVTIETWDDFIEAGKKVVAANEGVKFASTNADSSWFRMLANENGCAYFDETGENVTINQPGCVAALEVIGKAAKAGLYQTADWGETLQAINGNKLASAVYGGWYEGSIRASAPDQEGKWGVYPIPAFEKGGNRAANIGGSSLAVPTASKNPEAALAFINFALGTSEGQVAQLKASGLVPTLPDAVNDPFVKSPQPYWGGQPVWETIIGTLPDIKPARGTQYFAEADNVFLNAYNAFLANGGDAKEVLDGAADEISGATGLPVKE
ncbi:ABC transporter substrate-binding protein [Aureimonas leprariae]|uniref:Extracellular solute-binding protein n=1 Tax=Plantimonas leprariae TaxID=2615207 RepID=A0A7V7PNQ2_9HYPH|nr:extracellular solute-binding protein [Aureimonas leprariae]KAB0679378.1 extracellular solute-binding protein [Aureimonas leprariae]